jgi:hypothetical protein
MPIGLPFRRIWCIDFEFVANDGENPEPYAWWPKRWALAG